MAAAVVASSLLVACAGAMRPTAVAPSLQRDGVPEGAGAVAWSPDGATLAIARPDGVALVDVRSGSARSIVVPGAVAVDWAPAQMLLVVERDAGVGRVVTIDAVTGERRVLHSDPALVAARWLDASEGAWMALSATHDIRSYGTDVTLTLTVSTGRAPARAHRWTLLLPTRNPAVDVARGWAAARPNPIDHRIALAQLRKAPLFPPYLAVVVLDPFDGEAEDVAKVELGRWTATTTWAPDGRRAALAAQDGTLRIVERGRQVEAPPGAARGLHPSWHPGADVLFFGGWLVTPEATPIRKLVDRAADATGFWSPAGDRLAVTVAGRLFVFGDLSIPPPDAETERRRRAARASSWELGSLRSEGLLAPAIYRERRDRLSERGAEVP